MEKERKGVREADYVGSLVRWRRIGRVDDGAGWRGMKMGDGGGRKG